MSIEDNKPAPTTSSPADNKPASTAPSPLAAVPRRTIVTTTRDRGRPAPAKAPVVEDPGQRDPACAAQFRHRSGCSCTGKMRAPVSRAPMLRR